MKLILNIYMKLLQPIGLSKPVVSARQGFRQNKGLCQGAICLVTKERHHYAMFGLPLPTAHSG